MLLPAKLVMRAADARKLCVMCAIPVVVSHTDKTALGSISEHFPYPLSTGHIATCLQGRAQAILSVVDNTRLLERMTTSSNSHFSSARCRAGERETTSMSTGQETAAITAATCRAHSSSVHSTTTEG